MEVANVVAVILCDRSPYQISNDAMRMYNDAMLIHLQELVKRGNSDGEISPAHVHVGYCTTVNDAEMTLYASLY